MLDAQTQTPAARIPVSFHALLGEYDESGNGDADTTTVARCLSALGATLNAQSQAPGDPDLSLTEIQRSMHYREISEYNSLANKTSNLQNAE